MQLLLDQIHEPLEWQESVDLDADAFDREELRELGPIRVEGRVEPVYPGYHLRLRLSWNQTLECTRCLEPIEEEGAAETRLLLLTEARDGVEEELELKAEDLGVVVVEDGELATDPLVFEQVQLELPMKVLCREDCAGLCAQCGKNFNEGSCDCQPAADPRWEALADLKSS